MAHPLVAAWQEQGTIRTVAGSEVFVIDRRAPEEEGTVVVLHGFPTSSFDWRHVLDRLAARHRVVLHDHLGHGLSAKPDRRYSIELHADVAEALVHDLDPGPVTLVTHDLGDSVGGELLARSLDGTTSLDVVNRILTNGSIYLDLAQLTAGQELLLSMPDETGFPDIGDPSAVLAEAVGATFASSHTVDRDELAAHAELIVRADGHHLLPRLIRYIEDRRQHENRYTGAIEHHPSPLTVIWGAEDPIARVAMAHRLASARSGTALTVLDGIGHYPMIEAPGPFGDALEAALAG